LFIIIITTIIITIMIIIIIIIIIRHTVRVSYERVWFSILPSRVHKRNVKIKRDAKK